jgi:hypothetical protein
MKGNWPPPQTSPKGEFMPWTKFGAITLASSEKTLPERHTGPIFGPAV